MNRSISSSLLQPIQIGSQTLKNHFIHSLISFPYSLQKDLNQYRTYCVQRAKDGVAMFILKNGIVHLSGRANQNETLISYLSAKEIRPLVQDIHTHQSKIIWQLQHHGASVQHPLGITASHFYNTDTEYTSNRIPGVFVPQIIQWYTRAADLAIHIAGMDGIEIFAGQYSLINSFTSPRLNTRKDTWGYKKDYQLPLEIIRAIRKKIGPDPIISYRLSLMDLHREGLDWQSLITLASQLIDCGVNHFSFSFGLSSNRYPIATNQTPFNVWNDFIQKFAREIPIPVSYGYKLGNWENLLERNPDLQNNTFEVNRAWFCEPNWLKKLIHNEQANHCLYCAQGCTSNQDIRCPYWYLPDPKKQKKITLRRKIIVIGAGPAGYTFALSAAMEGHDVTLIDKHDSLGGALKLARKIPDNQYVTQYLEKVQNLCTTLGIQCIYNTNVTVDYLLQHYPEYEYFIAPGQYEVLPAIDGMDHSHVLTYEEILNNKQSFGHRIAILSDNTIGVDLAKFFLQEKKNLSSEEWLQAWGIGDPAKYRGGIRGFIPHLDAVKRSVFLFDMNTPSIRNTLKQQNRYYELQWLRMLGAQIISNAKITNVDPYYVRFLDQLTNETNQLRIDHFVCCFNTEFKNDLVHEMKNKNLQFQIIHNPCSSESKFDLITAIKNAQLKAKEEFN